MEFYKTQMRGSEITVIFTGKNYFFHSSFYGWLAVAERTEESYERLGTDAYKQDFILRVGNEYTLGGRMTNGVVAAAAKKFIRKNEQRYLPTQCEFQEETVNLNLWYGHFELLPYKSA